MQKLVMHPLNYLLIPFIGIAAIFSFNTLYQYLFIDLILFGFICITNQVKIKSIIVFLLCLTPALLSYYFTGYIFGINQNEILLLIVRLTSLSFISFIYVLHMPHEETLNELMQRKLLPITIGFAILATLNAFIYLKNEYNKIQIAYKMRFGKNHISPKLILPLLVSASRYAHHLSLSMHSRGLNKNRTFFQNIKPIKIPDIVVLGILITMIFIIISKHL